MREGALLEFLEAVPEELLDPATLGVGQGVRVAIIDSGIDAGHPDLRAGVERSVEVRMAGGRPVMVEAPARDPAGHGTACADIIGRLAPECRLWNVRALGDDCRGSSAALLAALRWAIEQGAEVINLSLGTREPVMAEPLRQLVDAAYRKGLLIVAATNNVPGVHSYPAVFTSLVCVDAAYLPDAETFYFRFGELVSSRPRASTSTPPGPAAAAGWSPAPASRARTSAATSPGWSRPTRASSRSGKDGPLRHGPPPRRGQGVGRRGRRASPRA
jgi:subtilisin family serine protease